MWEVTILWKVATILSVLQYSVQCKVEGYKGAVYKERNFYADLSLDANHLDGQELV